MCVSASQTSLWPRTLYSMSMSLLLRSAEPNAMLQAWRHQCWAEGQHHLPQPVGKTGTSCCSPEYHQPSLQQGHVADSWLTWCWPGAAAAFQPGGPSTCCCLGLLFPRSRTLHFPCWTKPSRDTTKHVNWICSLGSIKLCHITTPHFHTFPVTPKGVWLSSAPQNCADTQIFTWSVWGVLKFADRISLWWLHREMTHF